MSDGSGGERARQAGLGCGGKGAAVEMATREGQTVAPGRPGYICSGNFSDGNGGDERRCFRCGVTIGRHPPRMCAMSCRPFRIPGWPVPMLMGTVPFMCPNPDQQCSHPVGKPHSFS